jgi:hypothetical protein
MKLPATTTETFNNIQIRGAELPATNRKRPGLDLPRTTAEISISIYDLYALHDSPDLIRGMELPTTT